MDYNNNTLSKLLKITSGGLFNNLDINVVKDKLLSEGFTMKQIITYYKHQKNNMMNIMICVLLRGWLI